jgi:hypothetical protein
MRFDPADSAAIRQHLSERGIRGCSTCGEEEMHPVVHGYLTIEPLQDPVERQRVVLVGCNKCGRMLLFAADAITGLAQPR